MRRRRTSRTSASSAGGKDPVHGDAGRGDGDGAPARADRAKLTETVYNVSAFSESAGQIADRVRAAFPGAQISFAPDAVRSKIVDSWPETWTTRVRERTGAGSRVRRGACVRRISDPDDQEALQRSVCVARFSQKRFGAGEPTVDDGVEYVWLVGASDAPRVREERPIAVRFAHGREEALERRELGRAVSGLEPRPRKANRSAIPLSISVSRATPTTLRPRA